jgi:hypothetical protein
MWVVLAETDAMDGGAEGSDDIYSKYHAHARVRSSWNEAACDHERDWEGEETRRWEGRRTILIGLSEDDHVLWKDLGDASYSGADDEEAGGGCFEDGDTKGFGEGCVEEDLASSEHLERRNARPCGQLCRSW